MGTPCGPKPAIRFMNYASSVIFKNILYKIVYNNNNGINGNFRSSIITGGIITEQMKSERKLVRFCMRSYEKPRIWSALFEVAT